MPLEEEGGNQFALDHLFLDQDAVPTLVEVKRSSGSASALAAFRSDTELSEPGAFVPGPPSAKARLRQKRWAGPESPQSKGW